MPTRDLTRARKGVVIGAGPVGCLAAQMLANRGYEVDVFEKRPALQRQPAMAEGRTIGLSLSPRGMQALETFGCAEPVREIATPMDRRILHPVSGPPVQAEYGPGCWNQAVSRNELNRVLFQRASAGGGIRFHFGHACEDIDPGTRELQFNGQTRRIRYDLLLAADGAHSKIREQLSQKGILVAEKSQLSALYRELTVSESGLLSRSAIHIWPRSGFFLVAIPNRNGGFTGTLVLGEHSARKLRELESPQLAAKFLASHFPDAFAGLATLEAELASPALHGITTASCSSLHYADSIVLMGDAAHAIAPFLGQGINLGFEDCQTLARLLDEASCVEHAVRQYTTQRKANGDAAAQLSLANYRELAANLDHPGSAIRSTGRPGHGMPVVTAVNFMNLSYLEVWRRFYGQPETCPERNETIHA